MSEQTDDPAGLQQVQADAERSVERSLDAWGDSAPGPDWSASRDDREASGAGPAGPAPEAAGWLGASGLQPLLTLARRLVALTEQRPEAGLGIAFVGGLVLATIIKRLGRR